MAYALAEVGGRLMGLGALAWGNRAEPKIALTFDDGPSQQTPALLELLEQHGVRATFFLTGQHSEARPDLVEQLKQHGHQLEAHGYWHRPALLMAPWTEWAQIERSPGKLYRPPWGIHSPFTRFFAGRLGKRVMLWDLESGDWLKQSPQELAQRILFYVKPGSVVLLHDGPERTLEVLGLLLPRLSEYGYKPVRLDQMELRPLGLRQGLERALQGPEERYDRRGHMFKAGYKPNHIFRLELQAFPGPDLPGYPKGTPCLWIHFESARMAALSPMQVLRAFRETLKETAKLMEQYPQAQLIYGFSYLGQGAKALGFELHPLPRRAEWQSKITTAWFTWLYTGQIPKHLLKDPAQVIYMTRETLLSKYGAKGPPA
jgi:peptidoglycan/xylan/chitin deacetylase (PgdA/CDA1 family)